MKCKQCGTEFEGKFCPECGAKTEAETPVTPPPIQQQQQVYQQSAPATAKPKKKKKPFFLRWWFILLAIIVVGVIALSAGGGEKIVWDDIILGDMLPEPPANKGEIHTNSADELWIDINDVLDGVTYKTDDSGNIYSIDGKLQPNNTYVLNGNIYATDENGRIISCKAKPVRSPENPRDNEAQQQAGGEDRRPNDQGGHIVGRDMNGDGGIGNLVAMDSKINQSDYKRMENSIKADLDEGKEVTVKTEMTYSGDSERPDKITVTVTADGKDTVYKFDNNLDGSLRDEVPENGKETVQDRLDETGGEISSIKEEYDENGNLVETTVYITYKGEDGTNYRTSVVVENQ